MHERKYEPIIDVDGTLIGYFGPLEHVSGFVVYDAEFNLLGSARNFGMAEQMAREQRRQMAIPSRRY